MFSVPSGNPKAKAVTCVTWLPSKFKRPKAGYRVRVYAGYLPPSEDRRNCKVGCPQEEFRVWRCFRCPSEDFQPSEFGWCCSSGDS